MGQTKWVKDLFPDNFLLSPIRGANNGTVTLLFSAELLSPIRGANSITFGFLAEDKGQILSSVIMTGLLSLLTFRFSLLSYAVKNHTTSFKRYYTESRNWIPNFEFQTASMNDNEDKVELLLLERKEDNDFTELFK